METSAQHISICNKNCPTDAHDMDVLKSTTDTKKLNTKYDNLTDDVDDDKCVNNHKICNNNNLKNAKIIHGDTDCNVVIDNNDDDGGNGDNQTKQLQQQQQQSQIKQPPFELSPQTPLPPSASPSPPQQQQPSTYGCKHYKRKAKFVVSIHKHPKKRTHINTIVSQICIHVCVCVYNKFIRQTNTSIWFNNIIYLKDTLRFGSF